MGDSSDGWQEVCGRRGRGSHRRQACVGGGGTRGLPAREFTLQRATAASQGRGLVLRVGGQRVRPGGAAFPLGGRRRVAGCRVSHVPPPWWSWRRQPWSGRWKEGRQGDRSDGGWGPGGGRPEKASGFYSHCEGSSRVCVELRCERILFLFQKITWLLWRRQRGGLGGF